MSISQNQDIHLIGFPHSWQWSSEEEEDVVPGEGIMFPEKWEWPWHLNEMGLTHLQTNNKQVY